MIPMGKIDMPFSVQAQSIDVNFDSTTHHQILTFKFGLSISLPQMLQHLQKFQYRDAMPLLPQDNAGSQQGRQGYPQQGSLEGVNPLMMSSQSNPGVQKMWGDAPKGMRPPMQPAPQFPAVVPPMQPAPQLPQVPQVPQAPQPPQSAPMQLAPQLPQAPQLPLQPPLSTDSSHSVGPEGSSMGGTAALPVNIALIDALRENNLGKAQLAIQQRADVDCSDARQGRTPLHHALEAGGSVEAVNLLLQSMANANAATIRGKTPLHYVIQQYSTTPPVVIPMLLTWKADLHKPDCRGTTPLQTAKLVAKQLTTADGWTSAAESARVRQLLYEVTEQPTVAVVVVDAKEVKRALFADMANDRLVFHTESSVGLYSLKERRMIFMKRLRMQAASTVQHVAVNPQLGTIAVCLCITESGEGGSPSMQNVTIVWPNGHLQDEEPLKLTMNMKMGAEGGQRPDLQPRVAMTRGQGPQMLLSRLSDGQVFCWRLNSARSQLMSEVKLLHRGGLMALSDDGCWIAVVNKAKEDENQPQLEIWAYESLSRPQQSPKHLTTMKMRPVGLAIIHQQVAEGGQPSCLLAVAEAGAPGVPQPPVEILSVDMSGSISIAYRIQSRSLCHSLDFCGVGEDLRLLSGHADGLAIVCKPSTGEIGMSHDSPGIGQVAISPDHTLIASVESNYMRVYKVPVPDTQ